MRRKVKWSWKFGAWYEPAPRVTLRGITFVRAWMFDHVRLKEWCKGEVEIELL